LQNKHWIMIINCIDIREIVIFLRHYKINLDSYFFDLIETIKLTQILNRYSKVILILGFVHRTMVSLKWRELYPRNNSTGRSTENRDMR